MNTVDVVQALSLGEDGRVVEGERGAEKGGGGGALPLECGSSNPRRVRLAGTGGRKGMEEALPVDSVAAPGSYPLQDLAILDVEEAAGWGHPCAALATERPELGVRDGLYLAGYTVEHGARPALTGATTEF